MEEYRDEHAIELKNYIASYGQKPENKKNARLRLKRWRLTNLERQRKINRVSESLLVIIGAGFGGGGG
jgi:hypothetical protein